MNYQCYDKNIDDEMATMYYLSIPSSIKQ